MQTSPFCQYANGICPEVLATEPTSKGFFMYPSEPAHLSETIQEAVRELQKCDSEQSWQSWRDLSNVGRIVFCEICKAIRTSELTVANITTLNFNVLFELGYGIGLNKRVLPIRDTSYEQDKALFDELGIFDVLGYKPFENRNDIISLVTRYLPATALTLTGAAVNKQHPIYVMRSPVESDGSVRLFSCLKKCAFRFRTFDFRETPRLSLHEAYRQVTSSVGVVAHLLDPKRSGARRHNALGAFVCGMAMAMGKRVLMLQEGYTDQPIDYRDVVKPYRDAHAIPSIVTNFVRDVADAVLGVSDTDFSAPQGLLASIDLGDTAAENEIQTLPRYFVRTPQYQAARRGHARLVVGRKGSGKTAVFYGVRNDLWRTRDTLVLDLKPEGHQLTKLRETVIDHMNEGAQLHMLTAFWKYVLLLELAQKLLNRDRNKAYSDPAALASFSALEDHYHKHVGVQQGDFSERIMALVDRIVAEFPKTQAGGKLDSGAITHMIYRQDVERLQQAVATQLESRDEVWLLFDNLDKGWPVGGAQSADIAMIRCLLDATRSLEGSWRPKHVDFRSIVFLRKDIADLLLRLTPDRGKETVENLAWSDVALLEELLLKRFTTHPALSGGFRDVWTRVFEAHVGGQDSFTYVLDRTFLQPRSVLNFVTKCIQIAVSHDHQRVTEDDITTAEKAFSEDMLNNVGFEIGDAFPEFADILYGFYRYGVNLSREDIELVLSMAGVPERKVDDILDLLLWFSFLGVRTGTDSRYSYQVAYNMRKYKELIPSKAKNAKVYCIHPAFHASLELDHSG